jgi:hypothetical protein
MEGSVLSFLKAEWKVSDTGSAHWASSLHLVANFSGLSIFACPFRKQELPMAAMFVNRSERN